MATDDLLRTQTAISAFSASTLAWDSWPLDSITAAGMAGIRNPLGNKLMHFISEPSGAKTLEIVLMIATRLIKDGSEPDRARDYAYLAFDYWNNQHCQHCHGRGVMDFEQTECPRCQGTKTRPIPAEYADPVRKAISVLIEAEQWTERQLRARLAPVYVPDPVYSISGQWDYSSKVATSPEAGWVTPKKQGCE